MENAARSYSPCCCLALNSPYYRRQRAGRPRGSLLQRGKSGLHGTTVPGNARRRAVASAKVLQGQCHRKQTAELRPGKVERVRQERTAVLATGSARQTPPGARPNRGGKWARF